MNTETPSYKIQPYTKKDGTTSFELLHVASNTVVARDYSYLELKRIKKGLEQQSVAA